MQRYFIKKSANEDRFILDKEDRHHIVKVMRMEIGDRIICAGPDGKTAECEIQEITDDSVVAHIVKWKNENPELPIHIAIASGLPKGDKLEWIIQKGTELGANQFLPFTAHRSVVKWDEKKAVKKLERWQKIAKEAAEQSHRSVCPEVFLPFSLKALLEKSKDYTYKLVAFEDESRSGEKSMFSKTLNQMNKEDSLLLVFGPEGGLAVEEIKLLSDHGFFLCGLGPRILRTETAPLYALSAASYHFELMG